jgi:hypothetical protein
MRLLAGTVGNDGAVDNAWMQLEQRRLTHARIDALAGNLARAGRSAA